MLNEQAPLCFGAVTFFSVDADRCKECSHFQECSSKVKQNIAEIGRVLDIEELMARHEQAKLAKMSAAKRKKYLDDGKLKTQATTVEQNSAIGEATVAAEEAALLIEIKQEAKVILKMTLKAGKPAELLQSLRDGVNPFPKAMSDQWVLGELLIRGKATRTLIESVIQRRGGKATTAKALETAMVGAQLVVSNGDLIEINKKEIA